MNVPLFLAGFAVLLVGVAMVSYAWGDYLGERDARRAHHARALRRRVHLPDRDPSP